LRAAISRRQRNNRVAAGLRYAVHLKETIMMYTLAVILVLAWILGFGVFHVAGGLIHLLLLLAVISILWHFVRGRRVV
jgi:hypothetical protein